MLHIQVFSLAAGLRITFAAVGVALAGLLAGVGASGLLLGVAARQLAGAVLGGLLLRHRAGA